MGIDVKDIKIGDRYLCSFPNEGGYINDCIVVEFSPINLQKIQYVRLKYEDVNSGIPVKKWVVLDIFLCSVLEKLEENDDDDTYLEWPPIEAEGLKSEIEKVDYLQEFAKLQTEYLKMLIEEKKDTDNWKG